MERYRAIGSPKADRKSPSLPVIAEEEEAAAVTRIVLLKRTFLPVGNASEARGDQEFFAKIEQKRIERERTFAAAAVRPAAATDRKAGPLPRRLRPKNQTPRALDVLALKKLTLHAKGEGYHKRLSELQTKVQAWYSFKLSNKLSKSTKTSAAKADAVTFDRLEFTRLLSSVLEITYLDDALDIRNLVFQEKSTKLSQEQLDVYLKPVLEWEALFGASGSRRLIPERPCSHLELLLEASLNECKPVTPDILSAASKALLKQSDVGATGDGILVSADDDENIPRLNAIDKIVNRETKRSDPFQGLPTIIRAEWLAYYYRIKSIPMGSIRPPASTRPQNNTKSPSERRSRERITGPSDMHFFWAENADEDQTLPRMSWLKVIAFLRVDWVRSPGAFEDINLCREHLMPPPTGKCTSQRLFEEFIKIVDFFLNYRRSLSDTQKQDMLQRPSKMALAALPSTRLRVADLVNLVNKWGVHAEKGMEEEENSDYSDGDDGVEVNTPPLLQDLLQRMDLETRTLSVAEWVSSIYSINRQTTFAM